jgi:ATP-dependent Clp protease adaptor protein ClpS
MPSEPLYNLILLNDAEHTFDYVIDMLKDLFAVPEDRAIEHAMDVHMNARTLVMTGGEAAAEHGRALILARGADHRLPYSKGSMRARVEACVAPPSDSV